MILIRTDANERIGAGHVMRCLTIAHALVHHGERVVFVTADHKADKLIGSCGFEAVCLNSDYTDMENDHLDHLAASMGADLLLLDSYFVTSSLFHMLAPAVKTAYMDDLNESRWNTGCLINYNITADTYDYSRYNGTGTVLLRGPRYAPLRDEFINISSHGIKAVEDVLVSAGGADPDQISEKIMKGIVPDYPEVNFHFIVGALNPRLEAIKDLAADYSNTVLHINERRMADLMKKCDIAISAAGSTLYELCACGTPTITYVLADNQTAAGAQFDQQGIMIDIGDCRNDPGFIDRLKESFKTLKENSCLRSDLSRNMQGLVDGYGAYRIADELLKQIAEL